MQKPKNKFTNRKQLMKYVRELSTRVDAKELSIMYEYKKGTRKLKIF